MIGMHIAFAWFGAVGYVLIQVLEELAKKTWKPHTYTILVRRDTISDELHALQIAANVVIVWDMPKFFAEGTGLAEDVDWMINCATPMFNKGIMQWCLHNNSNYMDFASILWPEDVRAGCVQQDEFHEAFLKAGLLAVVNAGISPGLTDVLTWYLIKKHNITPVSYNLYLDENFNSMVPLFSWSPSVALDEVLTPAFVLDDGVVRFDKPFTLIGYCVGNKCFNYYEITQEELLNMYHHYKDSLRSLKIAVGWTEIEHIKLLYTMGLLSDEQRVGELSLLDIVKSKMPKAATKEEMIDAMEKWLIDDAWFSFHIELGGHDKMHIVRAVFDFDAFKDLKNTSYYGATSISYPTGIAAGYIWGLAQAFTQKGVVSCLDIWLWVAETDIVDLIDAMNNKWITINIE